MTTHVLYHCDTDGRFAAYCAWRKFQEMDHIATADGKPLIQFYPVQYQEPCPLNIAVLTKDDTVYILDFSYDRETLDKIYLKAGKLQVLDHHKTAERNLEGAPYAFFDKTKSGALLAWEYFFPKKNAPLACLLANDFDLWQWKYRDTAAFEAWVRHDSVNDNWAKWHELCMDGIYLENCLKQGALLDQANQKMRESFIRREGNVRVFNYYHGPEHGGKGEVYKVAIHNGMGVQHSQIGSMILKEFEVDISVGYRILDDIIFFNVRSRDESRISAEKFANGYGGGGHGNAAGFRYPLATGFSVLKRLLGVY